MRNATVVGVNPTSGGMRENIAGKRSEIGRRIITITIGAMMITTDLPS
jgi:hypothetical protein